MFDLGHGVRRIQADSGEVARCATLRSLIDGSLTATVRIVLWRTPDWRRSDRPPQLVAVVGELIAVTAAARDVPPSITGNAAAGIELDVAALEQYLLQLSAGALNPRLHP